METQMVLLSQHDDRSSQPQPNDVQTSNPTDHERNQPQLKPTDATDVLMKIREELLLVKKENARLTQERGDLITDLEECKKELFRRMPASQISDDSIQKSMARIHRSIDSFVFNIMRDMSDDALYKFCQRKQQKHKQKQKKRKSRNPLSALFKEDISVWGPYDCSNFYILSVAIQLILDEYIFRDSYPLGITPDQIRVIEDVGNGMSSASQAQKQGNSDIWRSETLIALTALRENENRLEEASRKICSRLNDTFSPWLLEAGPFAKIEESFRKEILDPAIRLHQDLRSSIHQYEIQRIETLDLLPPKQMLKDWDLKRADTWQNARGEKDVGKALYCLHPAIVRLPTKGKTPIVIAKPVIVVTSAQRERIPNPYSQRDSSLSGSMAPPPAIRPSDTTEHSMSPLDKESSALRVSADEDSSSTESDSTAESRSGPLDSHGRRASTHPVTQRYEYPPDFYRRRSTVPMDSSQGRDDLREPHIYYPPTGERQTLAWSREDQDGPAYTRGQNIQQTPYTYPHPEAARHLPRKARRDKSGGRSSPRRPGNENPQPPVSPSTPVPVTSTAKLKKKSLFPSLFT